MKKLFYPIYFICIVGTLFFQSCEESDDTDFPLSALIYTSTDDLQVACTALTHSATSWSWDFGDGETSTEEDPVHVYEEGGYYQITLTAYDDNGNSASDTTTISLDLTPYAMLTGDYTVEGYDGKTWKLTTAHSSYDDYFGTADADFSLLLAMPTSVFTTSFGMGDIYEDEYTFYYDGSYSHDVKDDGGSLAGYVRELLVFNGGEGITNDGGSNYGVCIANYTPESDATFTYVEDEDFTVSTTNDGTITYKNVSTLDFSGTEFIALKDYENKAIINSISDDHMQLVLFLSADTSGAGTATYVLVLSFEVVE